MTNGPTALESASHWKRGRSILRRVTDFVFGFDYFISYRSSDGSHYARRLAEELTKVGFRCFLDNAELRVGDDWRRIVYWSLRRSTAMALVVSPDSHESNPVLQEVKTFMGFKRRISPIDFDESLQRSDSELSAIITSEVVSIRETSASLKGGPSEYAIQRLLRDFRETRQDHRRTMIAGVTAVVFFLLFAATSVLLYIANEENKRAEANLLAAENTVDYFLMDVAGNRQMLAGMPGTSVLRQKLLHRARDYFVALIERNHRATSERLAEAYGNLGVISMELGKHEESRKMFTLERQAYESLRPRISADKYTVGTAKNAVNFGVLELRNGNTRQAIKHLASAQAELDTISEGAPSSIQAAIARITLLCDLGHLLSEGGRDYARAESSLTKAIRLAESLASTQVGDDGIDLLLMMARANLVAVYQETGKLERALQVCEEFDLSVKRLTDERLQDPEVRLARASLNTNRANVYSAQMDRLNAAKWQQIAADELQMLLIDDPEKLSIKLALAQCQSNLAVVLSECGELENALMNADRAVTNWCHLLKEGPGVREYQLQAALASARRGLIAHENGDPAKSKFYLEESFKLAQLCPGDELIANQLGLMLWTSRLELIDALATDRQFVVPINRIQASISWLLRMQTPRDHYRRTHLANVLHQSATSLLGLGRRTDAETLSRRAALVSEQIPSDSKSTLNARATALHGLALILGEAGEIEEASEHAELSTKFARRLVAQYPEDADCQELLAACLNIAGAMKTNRTDRAKRFTEVLYVLDRLAESGQLSDKGKLTRAGAQVNLATLDMQSADTSQALEYLGKARTQLKQLITRRPTDRNAAGYYQNAVAVEILLRENRGFGAINLWNFDIAVREFRSAYTVGEEFRALVGDHEEIAVPTLGNYVNLALALARGGKLAEALPIATEARKLLEAYVETHPGVPKASEYLGNSIKTETDIRNAIGAPLHGRVSTNAN